MRVLLLLVVITTAWVIHRYEMIRLDPETTLMISVVGPVLLITWSAWGLWQHYYLRRALRGAGGNWLLIFTSCCTLIGAATRDPSNPSTRTATAKYDRCAPSAGVEAEMECGAAALTPRPLGPSQWPVQASQ